MQSGECGKRHPQATGRIDDYERNSVSFAVLVAIPNPVFPICVQEIDDNGDDQEIDCVIHGGPLQTNFEDTTSGLYAYHGIREWGGKSRP